MERYTRTQAARLIGVTRRTLYTWLTGSTQQMFTHQGVTGSFREECTLSAGSWREADWQ